MPGIPGLWGTYRTTVIIKGAVRACQKEAFFSVPGIGSSDHTTGVPYLVAGRELGVEEHRRKQVEPITFRAIERIVAVIIGGLCIYLGYRLFLHIPEEKEGAGKIILPGGISIYISRVGPGVFFALFGAIIVAFSIYQGIVYFRNVPHIGSSLQEYYTGLTQPSLDGEGMTDRRRRELRLEMEFLNTLPLILKTELSEQQKREVEYHNRSIKLALMKTVWGSDWGEFDQFKLWVESGMPDSVAKGLEEPASYYRTGLEMVK